MDLQNVLSYFKGVKKCQDGYMAFCPAHNDKNPSLSIGLSEDKKKILMNCFAGCSIENILSSAGLQISDLFEEEPTSRQDRLVVQNIPYHYYDVDGTLLYTKIRLNYSDGTKSFYFLKPDGTKGVKGVKRVPYNLPAVCKASKIYFVEGEKCADAVIRQGYCATTLDSGAKSKWLPEYNQYFTNKEIVVVPDNDEPGIQYAKRIASQLAGARIIPLQERSCDHE